MLQQSVSPSASYALLHPKASNFPTKCSLLLSQVFMPLSSANRFGKETPVAFNVTPCYGLKVAPDVLPVCLPQGLLRAAHPDNAQGRRGLEQRQQQLCEVEGTKEVDTQRDLQQQQQHQHGFAVAGVIGAFMTVMWWIGRRACGAAFELMSLLSDQNMLLYVADTQ
jgi:hypothetical protein